MPEAPLPRTLASPRTGLAPAGSLNLSPELHRTSFSSDTSDCWTYFSPSPLSGRRPVLLAQRRKLTPQRRLGHFARFNGGSSSVRITVSRASSVSASVTGIVTTRRWACIQRVSSSRRLWTGRSLREDRAEAEAQRGELLVLAEVHGGDATPQGVRRGRAAAPRGASQPRIDESRLDRGAQTGGEVGGTGVVDPPAVQAWRWQTRPLRGQHLGQGSRQSGSRNPRDIRPTLTVTTLAGARGTRRVVDLSSVPWSLSITTAPNANAVGAAQLDIRRPGVYLDHHTGQ